MDNAILPLEKRVLYSSTYFTPGDIAVEVLGTSGGSTSTTAAVPVSIQEFNPISQGQSPTLTISLPSGSTVSGSTHDLTDFFPQSTFYNGFMSRTTDGTGLVLVGYNAASGAALTAVTPGTSAYPRTIAVVNASGGVDTSTTFGGSAAQNLNLQVHGIASNDGKEFWVAGNGASGSISPLLYVASDGASTATPVANYNANGSAGATTNFRAVGFYGGQLYVSSGVSPIYGEATVGNISSGVASEPTGSTGTQPAYVLPAMGGNPGNGSQFVFLNSTTVYNADPSGGMQKWNYTGGQWVLQYGGDIPAPATSTSSDTSMQGLTIGPNGVLYGTTSGSSGNRLMQITDTGSGFSFVTLATAPPGEAFKGVSMTPAGAGITSITAPSTVTGNTVTLTATAAPTETAALLSSQATLPYTYAVGTVSSVSFFEQRGLSPAAFAQGSTDTFLGNGTYNSTTGQWVLANATYNNSAGTGTYGFYAIASESGGDQLYPNAVTGTGSGTTSGVGTGIGFEPTTNVLYSTTAAPSVNSVNTNISSVAIDGSVQFTATGIVAAPGDTGSTTVEFDAVGGGFTYYLGQGNAANNYTLTYSPDQYAIANSSGTVLSGLPQGTAYNIVAYANSSTGVQSLPATDYLALSVTTPSINFNQSTYNVSSTTTAPTTVTLYAYRTDYLNTASSVVWTTSGGGGTGSQTNASAGVFYGTNGSSTELTGTATFAFGSNTSSPITIPILDTPANQISTGVFTVTFTSPNVSAGAITATTAKLGTPNPAKVDILVSAETFNMSSPVVTVNASNDSSGYLYFTVNRNGYVGDAVSLNASTYTLSSSVAASMVQSNTGTGVGTIALANTDYTQQINTTVNFAVGQSDATIAVPFFTGTGDYNCSFGVSISGITGGSSTRSYTIVANQNTSIGTILSPNFGTSPLSDKPATATDVEVNSLYSPAPLPVVGDGSGGGNFGYLNYEVLEFSPGKSPGVYPPVGTNISSGASISSLSLSLYNTDNTSGDEYNGHVGNFNVYYINVSENSQPTGGFLFSNNSASYPTGFTLSASSAASSNAFYLGTFSFSDTLGYDTFTVVRGNGLNTSTGNFANAAFNSIAGALNSQSNFRLAITPASQGVGALDAEWAGISQLANAAPLLSINAATTKTATAEYFSFAQGGYTVNQNAGSQVITVIRSQTANGAPYAFADSNASVYFNVSSASAIYGTDYNASSQTLTFPAGVSSETVTVYIDPNGQVVTQGGDKQVVFSLSSPMNGSTGGYQTGLGSTPSTVLTIQDNKDAPGNNTSFETLTYYSDVASVVEAVGPYYTTQFSVGGSTPPSGGYASYGAASFEDGQIVQVNGNSVSNTVTPSNTIKAIDGITLDVYNLGGGASGPINIYFFNNSNSNIVPSIYPAAGSYYNPATYRYSDPHFFNFEYTEGLDPNPADTQSFGTPLLLGTINWSSSTAPGFTPLPLASYNSAIAQIVIADLNSGAPFQIAATPENSTVYAAWGGSTAYSTDANGNIITQAPYLSFSVTEGLPAWLGQNSVATWNASTHSLVVSGPSSIIANPGADEPNITFTGSGATLTFNTSAGTAIDLGSLAISHGANIVVNTPPSGVNTLVIGAPNTSAGTLGFTTDGTGRLNLGTSDMIVQQGNVSAVNGAIVSGYGNGTWNGATGIYSSAAFGNVSHLTALAEVVDDGTISNFEGVTTSSGDILIKYTYYGDADLSGIVDGSDYSRIDNAFTHPNTLSGWYNGDFNYDGTINGSDYTLIDNAFNTQVGKISASIATPTAMIADLATGKSSAKKSTGSTAVPPPIGSTNSSLFSSKKVKTSLIDLVLQDLLTGK